MKFYELGVYHHDCWNTQAITTFPDIFSIEWGNRSILQKTNAGSINSSIWKVGTHGTDESNAYVKYLKERRGVLDAKILSINAEEALIGIRWKSSRTSYETIMDSGCSFYSRTYSKNGYETYSVFADDPKEVTKLMNELDQIGETKMFSIKELGGYAGSSSSRFNLTPKQKDAILSAIIYGYYSWPRKSNLEKLAKKVGKKRRTLQENLRKAEAKILPHLLDDLALS